MYEVAASRYLSGARLVEGGRGKRVCNAVKDTFALRKRLCAKSNHKKRFCHVCVVSGRCAVVIVVRERPSKNPDHFDTELSLKSEISLIMARS